MKNPLVPMWKLIHSDTVLKWSFRSTIGTSFVCAGFIFWSWKKMPPQIPLYYSLPWGELQLAPSIHLAIVASGLGLLMICNYLLAMLLLRNNIFFIRLLLAGTAAFSFLFSISVVHIVLLVV